MNNIYINFYEFFKRSQPIKIFCGGEGIGKTYSTKNIIIEEFINTGKKTLWFFRYQSDFEEVFGEKWADDLPPETKEKITFKKDTLYYDKKPFLYFRILNRYIQGKGIPYDDVWLCVFDEFIITKSQRYLKDEIYAFKRWTQSVFRLRKVNWVLLANSLSFVNPYFEYFKIKKEKDKDFYATNTVYVYYCKANSNFKKIAKKSDYYNIFNDEHTLKFSLDGEFYFDNESLICSKPNGAKPIYKFKIFNEYFILYDIDKYLFIGKEKKIYTLSTFALQKQDVDINCEYSEHVNKILNEWYCAGQIYFEDLQTKSKILRCLSVKI